MFSVIYAAFANVPPRPRQLFVVAPQGQERDLSSYRLYVKMGDERPKLQEASKWTPHKKDRDCCVYFASSGKPYTNSLIGRCPDLSWVAMTIIGLDPAKFRCIEGDAEDQLLDIIEISE